jgi:hypothetical protein
LIRNNKHKVDVSNTANCEYHPDRIATTKCERCHRLICVNDKLIYRRTVSSGTGRHRHSRTYSYEYCPVCYAEAEINAATGPGAIFGSIFFIVFGIIWISLVSAVFPPFIIVGLGLIVLGIYNLITGPQKATSARSRQQRFLNSLSQSPSGITAKNPTNRIQPYRERKKWSNHEITCFECGNQIALSDDYCMNCGDSTVDERTQLVE